jgi:hypothetical protein
MVQLRLVAFMPKSQPLNDVGKVLYEDVGDRSKIVVVSIPAPNDFPVDEPQKWGEIFKAMRLKYAAALNIPDWSLWIRLLSVK